MSPPVDTAQHSEPEQFIDAALQELEQDLMRDLQVYDYKELADDLSAYDAANNDPAVAQQRPTLEWFDEQIRAIDNYSQHRREKCEKHYAHVAELLRMYADDLSSNRRRDAPSLRDLHRSPRGGNQAVGLTDSLLRLKRAGSRLTCLEDDHQDLKQTVEGLAKAWRALDEW